MSNETKPTYKPDIDFEKELFEAAVNLRDTVAPADYVPTSLTQLRPPAALPAPPLAALRTAPAFWAGVRGCRGAGEKGRSPPKGVLFSPAPPLLCSLAQVASTEGKRGGEFYTPSSIVRLLVRMLAPRAGKVFDPAAGSGGRLPLAADVIQSAEFTDRRHSLSFYGQERIDTTLRLCRA